MKVDNRFIRLNHQLRNINYSNVIVFVLLCMIFTILPTTKADAAEKQYGIVTSDSDGKFSFHDLNNPEDGGIEITASGKVMVPLEELAGLMPSLSYRYDAKSKKATLKNTMNGKRVVYTLNSKSFYYYSNAKSKGAKKVMTNKMYLSENSSSVMVDSTSLQWVMGVKGYQYYSIKEMQSAGYDTSVYSGLLIYSPFGKITSIPKATSVNGISATIKVTIPEGYSVAQTFDLLVKKGVCASTEFLYSAMETEDFSKYSFLSEISLDENRCFKLEGYLYPDTYEFYRLSKGSTVIHKILGNTETRLTEDIKTKASELGYSVDQIMTIASMIEKETGDANTMPTVASVIYNRLNKPMKLQLECTVNYIDRYVKPYISGDKDRYSAYYNTRKCSALPAGPICNPGKKAIQAALNPEQTDYFFFLSDEEGNYHFAVTYEEFEELKVQYIKTTEAVE